MSDSWDAESPNILTMHVPLGTAPQVGDRGKLMCNSPLEFQ